MIFITFRNPQKLFLWGVFYFCNTKGGFLYWNSCWRLLGVWQKMTKNVGLHLDLNQGPSRNHWNQEKNAHWSYSYILWPRNCIESLQELTKKDSNSTVDPCVQSPYIEVPRWEIFMEQELRFGLNLGRMAEFPAFIASKPFDLWNCHILKKCFWCMWHILMYQKHIESFKKYLKSFIG